MTTSSERKWFDGIIFDVDGTLWDSTPVVVRAYNEIIAADNNLNYQLTAQDLRNNFGKPMKEIGLTLLKDVPEEKNWPMMERILKRQDELLSQDPPIPYSGMIKVIEKLSSRYPLFIVSNCQAGYIERCISATHTEVYFKAHYCPDDTGLLKAGNIFLISRKYNLKNPVYVGDTEMDETACMEAGVSFIFAAYGFGKSQHPFASIQLPSDLLEFL